MPSKDVRIDLLMARHRRAVLSGEKASVRRIARLYRDVESAILADLRTVEGTIRELSAQGEEIPAYVLRRYGDLGAMIARTEARLDRFAETLAGDVLAQKERSARLGARQAGDLLKIEVGTSLRGLNEAAILQIVGSTAPGSPLRTLINEIPGAAIRSFERILVSGIALGQSPATIARRLRRDLGPNNVDGSPRALSVARALRITRNESIRALTAAQSATYAENSDVVIGMRIVSALDARTCPLCWARHGTILPVGATLPRHVACRCALAPVTRFSMKRKTGPEAFAQLSSIEQKEILGAGRHRLYLNGMKLEDIYRESVHPLWGPQIKARSIEDLAKLPRTAVARSARSGSGGDPEKLVKVKYRGGSDLDSMIEFVRPRKVETIVGHDAAGNLLGGGAWSGTKYSTKLDLLEGESFVGGRLAHNHPEGGPMSSADLATFVETQVEQFAVASKAWTVVLNRNGVEIDAIALPSILSEFGQIPRDVIRASNSSQSRSLIEALEAQIEYARRLGFTVDYRSGRP